MMINNSYNSLIPAIGTILEIFPASMPREMQWSGIDELSLAYVGKREDGKKVYVFTKVVGGVHIKEIEAVIDVYPVKMRRIKDILIPVMKELFFVDITNKEMPDSVAELKGTTVLHHRGYSMPGVNMRGRVTYDRNRIWNMWDGVELPKPRRVELLEIRFNENLLMPDTLVVKDLETGEVFTTDSGEPERWKRFVEQKQQIEF